MSARPLAFVRLAQAIAVNSILILGLFTGRLSSATVLVLYWFENLAASILIGLRVYIHRVATSKSGHYVLNSTKTSGKYAVKVKRSVGTLLSGYLIFAVGFTIGHAIFVGVIVGMLQESPADAFNRAEFIAGAKAISLFLLIGLIVDLSAIRKQPFAWIKLITNMIYLRVIVLQIVIIVGAGVSALLNVPRIVVVVFIGLKLLVDLLTSQLKPNAVQAITDEKEELPWDDAARERLLRSA